MSLDLVREHFSFSPGRPRYRCLFLLGSDKETEGQLVRKPFLYSLAGAAVQPRVKTFLCSLSPSERWEDCYCIGLPSGPFVSLGLASCRCSTCQPENTPWILCSVPCSEPLRFMVQACCLSGLQHLQFQDTPHIPQFLSH